MPEPGCHRTAASLLHSLRPVHLTAFTVPSTNPKQARIVPWLYLLGTHGELSLKGDIINKHEEATKPAAVLRGCPALQQQLPRPLLAERWSLQLKLTSFYITQAPYLVFHTPCSMSELLPLAWRDSWWHSDRIKQSCPLLKALISKQAEATALGAAFILSTLLQNHHLVCSHPTSTAPPLLSSFTFTTVHPTTYYKNFNIKHFPHPPWLSYLLCPTYSAAFTPHKIHAEAR